MALQQQQRQHYDYHDHHRQRPPAYTQHDPDSLELPSVPCDDLLAVSAPSAPINLPDLKSLNLPDAHHPPAHSNASAHPLRQPDSHPDLHQQWQHPTSGLHYAFPRVPSTDIASPRESVMSFDDHHSLPSHYHASTSSHHQHTPSAVSMDDPDVRMAAEALSGLGNPDFIRSPSVRSTTLAPHQPTAANTANGVITNGKRHSLSREASSPREPEPLLQLLTSSHPWVGGTINGSLSAYNATKNYSPRFVRSGAEFVERTIGSPVANTVGTVSRRTGVEGSIRRYLGGRRRSDMEDDFNQNKRRRVMGAKSEEMDVEKGMPPPPSPMEHRSRAESQASFPESLPAYDDNRSPQYEEESPSEEQQPQEQQQRQQLKSPIQTQPQQATTSKSHAWGTQLMITTSGLGAALSESSLRSLKYCLRLLRDATSHVGNVMRALMVILEDYERNLHEQQSAEQGKQQSAGEPVDHPMTNGDSNHHPNWSEQQENEARRIADAIQKHSNDIWETLRTVINNISRYTGGALPENASALVRRQLMSVPQRWRAASESAAAVATPTGPATDSTGTTETVRGAHRMLAFAKEGLDMMAQVSLVLEGTVHSAEQWLDSLGRRRDDRSSVDDEEVKSPLMVAGNGFKMDEKPQ